MLFTVRAVERATFDAWLAAGGAAGGDAGSASPAPGASGP